MPYKHPCLWKAESATEYIIQSKNKSTAESPIHKVIFRIMLTILSYPFPSMMPYVIWCSPMITRKEIKVIWSSILQDLPGEFQEFTEKNQSLDKVNRSGLVVGQTGSWDFRVPRLTFGLTFREVKVKINKVGMSKIPWKIVTFDILLYTSSLFNIILKPSGFWLFFNVQKRGWCGERCEISVLTRADRQCLVLQPQADNFETELTKFEKITLDWQPFTYVLRPFHNQSAR